MLNAQAVEFAKERGIAIYARATSGPLPGSDPSADGTVVRRHAPRQPGTVVGVASEREVLVLFSDDVELPLAFLDDRKIAGKQLHIAEGRLALVLSRENLHQEDRLRTDLASRFGDRVRLIDHLGAVSVVGTGINASFENVRRGTSAVSQTGIAVEGVATSSFRITWLLDRTRLDEAVRLLHQAFIESQHTPVP